MGALLANTSSSMVSPIALICLAALATTAMVLDTTAMDLDMDTTTARGLLSLLLSLLLLLSPRPIPTMATTASATTAMVMDTTATDLDTTEDTATATTATPMPGTASTTAS